MRLHVKEGYFFTPPKRVTSPIWGPPPSCKQALISKTATLHVQHTFFVYFLAVLLHDYNVKLPETS